MAAYYVVSEALTNATRHAQASVVRVAVKEQGDSLHLSIRDAAWAAPILPAARA